MKKLSVLIVIIVAFVAVVGFAQSQDSGQSQNVTDLSFILVHSEDNVLPTYQENDTFVVIGVFIHGNLNRSLDEDDLYNVGYLRLQDAPQAEGMTKVAGTARSTRENTLTLHKFDNWVLEFEVDGKLFHLVYNDGVYEGYVVLNNGNGLVRKSVMFQEI